MRMKSTPFVLFLSVLWCLIGLNPVQAYLVVIGKVPKGMENVKGGQADHSEKGGGSGFLRALNTFVNPVGTLITEHVGNVVDHAEQFVKYPNKEFHQIVVINFWPVAMATEPKHFLENPYATMNKDYQKFLKTIKKIDNEYKRAGNRIDRAVKKALPEGVNIGPGVSINVNSDGTVYAGNQGPAYRIQYENSSKPQDVNYAVLRRHFSEFYREIRADLEKTPFFKSLEAVNAYQYLAMSHLHSAEKMRQAAIKDPEYLSVAQHELSVAEAMFDFAKGIANGVNQANKELLPDLNAAIDSAGRMLQNPEKLYDLALQTISQFDAKVCGLKLANFFSTKWRDFTYADDQKRGEMAGDLAYSLLTGLIAPERMAPQMSALSFKGTQLVSNLRYLAKEAVRIPGNILEGIYPYAFSERGSLTIFEEISDPKTFVELNKMAMSAENIAARIIIKTPTNPAVQELTKEAIYARKQVEEGATLYRLGTRNKSLTGKQAQHWSLENPSTPGYGDKYGIPKENIEVANFIETATLKKGSPFITRSAPPPTGIEGGTGGGIEVVVPQGGVVIKGHISTLGE